MGKRKNSKAGLVRQILAKLGWDASPKDVIDSLAAQGITVTPQQVSNEKTKRKRASQTAAQAEDLPVSLLKKVKALVDEVGSTNLVRRALDELEALTSPGPPLD